MIKSIVITNDLDESIVLDLSFPELSGILVQDITGLGPSKANINYTELASSDGSMFNSSRLTTRNIVMSLVFLEYPTIEDSRILTYKYFPIKKRIKITINTEKRSCYTYGYIESNTPVIFSSKQETQISIICPDPYLYSLTPTITQFSGTVPNFQFPFQNYSTDYPAITFGGVIRSGERNIIYTGDEPIGMTVSIKLSSYIDDLSIYNSYSGEVLIISAFKVEFVLGTGMKPGDEIEISTVRGSKHVYLTRDGVTYNIINCIDKISKWIQLVPGNNVLGFHTNNGINGIMMSVSNNTIYEGV